MSSGSENWLKSGNWARECKSPLEYLILALGSSILHLVRFYILNNNLVSSWEHYVCYNY